MKLKGPLATVFAGNSLRSLFFIIQGFAVAKILGAAAFGVLSLAMSFVALVFGVMDFKIAESAIKFLAEYRHRRDSAATRLTSLVFLGVEVAKGLAAMLVVLVAAWPVAHHFYHQPELFGLSVLVASHSFFLAINPTATALLRLGGYFRTIAAYDVAFGAVSLLATVTVASEWRTAASVAWVTAGVGLLGGVAKTAICWWVYRAAARPAAMLALLRGWRSIAIEWRRIFHFSLDVNISATLRYVSRNLDVLVLSKFAPMAAVGSYSLARKMGNLLAYLTDPLPVVIYPEMARCWAAGDAQRVRRLFNRVTLASTLLVLAANLGLIGAAAWVLPRFFEKDYADAVRILWFLLPATVLAAGLFCVYYVLLTMGRSRTLLVGGALLFGATVVAVPPLSWAWQGVGAAIAVSLAMVVSKVYLLAVTSKGLRTLAPAAP